MISGVMWAACGELESISCYKVLLLLCHKQTAIVTDDLLRMQTTGMEELTAEITSLDVRDGNE